MKKLFVILVIIAIFTTMLVWIYQPPKTFVVISVVTPQKIYIDINKNNKADKEELINIFGIKDFYSFNKYETEKFKELNNFTDKEFQDIKTDSLNFSKKLLIGKEIEAQKVFHLQNTYVIKINNHNYAQLLLYNNYAIKYFIKKQKSKTTKKEIKNNNYCSNPANCVLLNEKSNKYHKLDCIYGKKSKDFILIPIERLPKNAKKCHFCFKEEKPTPKKPSLKFSKNGITFNISDFGSVLKPNGYCSGNVCKMISTNVANAGNNIQIALYEITPNNKIHQELIKAQNKGIKIKIATDAKIKEEDKINQNIFLKDFSDTSIEPEFHSKKLMHNKFMIIDNKIVQTGSLNYSNNDLSEFNSNVIITINNPKIAQIYQTEFEEMYKGNFHESKSINKTNRCVNYTNSEKACVYFSPQDKIIDNQLIPLLQKTQKSLYIPIFVITYKPLANEIINAHKRGVDVKLIVDATSAGREYYLVKYLRGAGIPVKVENFAGKMHMKTIISDEKILAVGSMNFSHSGQNKNDENFIIFYDSFFAKKYAEYFKYLWAIIPDKWLKYSPGAESKNSIGSCSDGIDNNYNGQIDSQDKACK